MNARREQAFNVTITNVCLFKYNVTSTLLWFTQIRETALAMSVMPMRMGLCITLLVINWHSTLLLITSQTTRECWCPSKQVCPALTCFTYFLTDTVYLFPVEDPDLVNRPPLFFLRTPGPFWLSWVGPIFSQKFIFLQFNSFKSNIFWLT